MKFLKRANDVFFSTRSAGLYILLFAVAIGVATFIENDFGTSSAQKIVFKSWWFELILCLFGISLISNIVRYRMFQQKKWALLTFHLSMIVILAGAGVTRYFGSEGVMHIRENGAANSFLSSETYLLFEVRQNGKKYLFDEPVLFASLGNNRMKRSYLIGDKEIGFETLEFMPNPAEELVDDPIAGIPILKVVVGGMQGRQEYLVRYGDRMNIDGAVFNFGNPEEPDAVNIKYVNDSLLFKAPVTLSQMVMATQTRDTLSAGTYHPLLLRSLYSSGSSNFVVGDFKPKAQVELSSASKKMTGSSLGAVKMKIRVGKQEQERFVVGSQGQEGDPVMVTDGQTSLSVSYGAKRVQLPFSIQLRDFIMERYPGTNSASSYASEITLNDKRSNLSRDQRIYMNHILNYGGYRFFQSSFDQDELGTYLSVNHDAPGTWISYLGYILLTLGMILTLFDKKSRFQQLSANIKKIRMAQKPLSVAIIAVFIGWATPAQCDPPLTKISTEHADNFGRLLVQDNQGRIKPMNSFSNELVRKLSRKESLYGMSADQIVLGMNAAPEIWNSVPLIYVGSHEEIKKIIKTSGKLASYVDFFDDRGNYLLEPYVRKAIAAQPRDRGAFEKDLLKLDEKVNICDMIFSGRFMKVFPIPNDETFTWQSPNADPHGHNTPAPNEFVEKFYLVYQPTLKSAIESQDWALADKLIGELNKYQQKYGGSVLPSEARINAELLLNGLNVFGRLDTLYWLLGLSFLVLFFISVFKPSANLKWPFRITLGLFAFGVFMHTFGLGLRWYVSGRAPWSNGYESMIYIGWTTVLAGLLFARKSLGGLTASAVLAATILMVAGLSWLDPEITPLVPVLKSYWLTIHVSLEAGSYGFLMLGAIIGVLNLVFMIFANSKNSENVYRIIKEMTMISEMTMIGGLIMLSVGTYLGGVWANESWGRYWGWDAKETWALVTILVYAFILHMRLIPGLRGIYAFNLASLFGWASVVMTYFGVNYYLSGLHSYAAGDPVPVPSFVYYTVAILAAISVLAYWKHRGVKS